MYLFDFKSNIHKNVISNICTYRVLRPAVYIFSGTLHDEGSPGIAKTCVLVYIYIYIYIHHIYIYAIYIYIYLYELCFRDKLCLCMRIDLYIIHVDICVHIRQPSLNAQVYWIKRNRPCSTFIFPLPVPSPRGGLLSEED